MSGGAGELMTSHYVEGVFENARPANTYIYEVWSFRTLAEVAKHFLIEQAISKEEEK